MYNVRWVEPYLHPKYASWEPATYLSVCLLVGS